MLFNHCLVVAKFTVTVPKADPGEYFPDLNLLTKLLAPCGATDAKQPKIELLGLYLAWFDTKYVYNFVMITD